MPRPVSHPHLEAEAQGYPLSSRAAFDLRLTALSRHASGVLDSASTFHLAAALEAHLRPRAGGMSLEVLRQIRDAAWFPSEPIRHQVSLAKHLQRLATRLLVHAGRRVSLRPDGDPTERATRWRWLSLSLPADLLIAACASQTPMEPPDDGVLVVTPRLAEVLRRPAAETHLHVGAAVPFGLLWAARMRSMATETTIELKSWVGDPPFGDLQSFRTMLLSAGTVRLLLASFLRAREQHTTSAGFEPFLQTHLPALAESLPWGLGASEARRGLLQAIHHLQGRGPRPELERARRLYQALSGRSDRPGKPRSIEDVGLADPLATWLPVREGLALPETRFTCRALRYLTGDTGEGAGDELFALLFWQYQRARNLTYRFLVEEPGTAGLDWFTRHYARISPLRVDLKSLTYASALRLQSRDLALGALEARTSPGSRWIEVRDEVRALARAAHRFTPLPSRDRPEIGLVLHFIKEWETTLPGGKRRLLADPRHTAFGCRFGPWFHKRLAEAMAMETALRHHPELLLVLRGVDVANVELGIPTWPLVPLFRRVRQASRQASARLARFRPRWEVPALRATVHAGEDYRRLVEGLRRIHEPIEYGMLDVGDRIGHGVALGTEPGRWREASRVVVQPAEERLDDLLWEIERYRQAEIPADTGRIEYVRAEAVRLGNLIYDGDERVDLDDLVMARRLRHYPWVLDQVGYPFFRERPFRRPAHRLFQRHLTDADVFERGQRPVEVRCDDMEVAMLRAVQRWLRGVLGRMEITVEANPSSNLLIADYTSLDEHAAFRFQPLRSMSAPDGDPVLVSVNTDNPLTFSSTLADEFAHVYFALLGQGVSADEALGWLDRARENGFASRFTLRASADQAALGELSPAARAPGQRPRSRPRETSSGSS